MLIGCPTEIKPQEFRVGLMPSAVFELTERGHQVMMEMIVTEILRTIQLLLA